MTPTTTMNVKVTYYLSSAGQKAALIAGRNASRIVTEVMPLDDPAQLDNVKIGADGALSLDVTSAPWQYSGHTGNLELDTPPNSVAEILAAYDTLKAVAAERNAAKKAQDEATEAERVAAVRAKQKQDAPLVDALLAELEALDPLAELPAGVSCHGFGLSRIGTGRDYYETEDQVARRKALLDRRQKAVEDKKAADAAAKRDKIDATVAEHGGYMWDLDGGRMCGFTGYALWRKGQTNRWIGKFSGAKGIDSFCDSPRGEFSFDVSALRRGDCIQGGGYDTNSRGRRRNETEFFGVVLRNDSILVVKDCDTRAAALKAAAKLQQEPVHA